MDPATNAVHSAIKSDVQSTYCKEQTVKYTSFYKRDLKEMVEHWLRYQLNENDVGKYDKAKRREVMDGVRSSDPFNSFHTTHMEF